MADGYWYMSTRGSDIRRAVASEKQAKDPVKGLKPTRTGSRLAEPAARPGHQKVAPAEPRDPQAEEAGNELDTSDQPGMRGFFSPELISRYSATMVSMLTHLIILLILALWMLPAVVTEHLDVLTSQLSLQDEQIEELATPFTQQETTTSVTMIAALSSASSAGAPGGASALALPVPDARFSERMDQIGTLGVEGLVRFSGKDHVMSELPYGTLGDSRAVVDNYDQAFDRITQEILLMLERSKVLAVWCFDQSGSMKDDQQEISGRIDRVYRELGISSAAAGDSLMTAVTSYGEKFRIHLAKPTSEVSQIRAAIKQVPTDPSGKEYLCGAIAQSIGKYREYAKRSRRRMALIVVSDESGDPNDNRLHLEKTIELAEDARCRVYVLGREAVFGYPYAHIRWVHPQTFDVHYLPVDRGPETALVEQLQTEGFHRRYDSHPSGFGPYVQTRLVRQSGGIYFILPSIEADVVDGEKRRYRMDAMRRYRPDLRAYNEVAEDIRDDNLRHVITKVIYDMNPYNPEAAKIIDMRVTFSLNRAEFVQQVQIELAKVTIYMAYLDKVRQFLEDNWHLHDREVSPRWQANSDLIRGQLLAYKIRLYEYAAYLKYFMKNPKVVSPTQAPNLVLYHWAISRRGEMITGDVTGKYVEQVVDLLTEVIENHPDTPWAARAEKEIYSGFGIELKPYYQQVPTGAGGAEPIPIPKL